ncbi:MAG: LamG-like jellyroll fold domain-containing protein, partial [Lentisphaerota bacterium]
PDAWYTKHPPAYDSEGIYHSTRWQSDIINYEHPQARAQYAAWFQAVCSRYKNNKAIVGWIIGNESGYLGLWSGLLDGYDPESEAAFRTWSQAKFVSLTNLNARWGTSYTSFTNIVFVDEYREYGKEGRQWADMVQWREDSIATFTAIGAKAAKTADTNHLISYSTVGMQWGEEDWRYHAEDREKITKACLATNAPIDFFSVNNYPWSVLGHESQNGQWGISYTKKTAGVPVLYSETGFTSSETMWPGMNEFRQGPLIRNALWESLEAGAIGTHIFAWHDRPYITDREKGFGILTAERGIKQAFWISRNAFALMEQAKIHELLMGSKDAKPDVAFLWTAANDSQYNRYECEMQQIAGAMERVGFEPYFINLNDLGSGAYTNYKVIILPRNMRVDSVVPGTTKGVLKFLREDVLTKGIHVMASADLPGMQDENGRARADFTNELALLFGVNGGDASGFEVAPRTGNYISSNMAPVKVVFSNAAGSLVNGYTCTPRVWKYNDEVKLATGGVLWATMDTGRNKGFEDVGTGLPGWFTWGTYTVVTNWGWQYEGIKMLRMWGDAGIWQEFQVAQGGTYAASAYLRSNTDDPLRNGKQAYVALEWYDMTKTNRIGVVESARLSTNTPGNSWVLYRVEGTAPTNALLARRVIRVGGTGDGSVYVDGNSKSPAVVVKNHGAAKAAIFLFSAGDVSPDGNNDGEMDVLPWKWRYDFFGSVLRNYFGVQPPLSVSGTNAFLCLAEYRTCTNGATLWQVKNYMYDRFHANGVGGGNQTFTIQSSLFSGKTVRAFEQGKIVETNSDGIISLTLPPDGQEMLLVYAQGTQRGEVVQIMDAPSVVHPTGDKVVQVNVKFDCRATTGLKLKVAFKEAGNNGDTLTNEIYAIVTNNVAGAGTTNAYLWIPDYSQKDTDYKSTPDGGKYEIAAWLENGTKVAEALSVPTMLEWGVRPTSATPTNLVKGSAYALPIEWEDLYEPLFWQNTPMARNASFPTRVGVFRSLKTETQFPGHLAKANAVADWLQTRGYTAGNPLDILFDNITVNGLFSDNFEDGNTVGWTRAAGCANWAVATSPTGALSGLVGYWKCDETNWTGVAGEVKDSSTRNGHGGSYNGARITNDARLGRAGWFDGTNDYVEIPNSTNLQVDGNLTLSFWIKPWNLTKGRINPLDKSYGGEFGLTIETNRQLTYYHGTARVSGKYMSWVALPAGTLANGSWQHVVLTRDVASRKLTCYLNGTLRTTTTYAFNTNTLPAKSTYPVRIAQGYTAYSLGGVMDDTKIFSKALTPDDVANEYRLGLGSKSLRIWRIGNSDNIQVAGTATWSNYTFSSDIRYNKQDNYFDDAELYFRYQDRANYYRIGVRNSYGFWRLKYTVMYRTNIVAQGWLSEFAKTNRPVENMWYNLQVQSYGTTNKVYFNGQLAGTFYATNLPRGMIGVGSRALQLGNWEPQKGYYFIDDDEWSFWAPEGQAQTRAKPLNLDWGYLQLFYSTMMFPGVYAMSDIEVSNVVTWATNGLHSLIVTDGGMAMRNETGATDLGRIEGLLGVSTAIRSMSGIRSVTLNSEDHYVKLDYAPGTVLSATGTAYAYSTPTTAKALGTVYTASNNAPAFLANLRLNNPAVPVKTFCFNYGVDTLSQLTTKAVKIAQRAFEWSRGDAYKCKIELKYTVNPNNPSQDFTVYTTNVWILAGSGSNNVSLVLPTDGIMTGTNMYWAMTMYPWDAADPWASHGGFYSSGNEGVKVRIPGKGLQVLGGPLAAYGGRAWDMWIAYNTEGSAVTLTYGLKDIGRMLDEDNFNDGNYTGWNISSHPNIAWSVTGGALRATTVSTGGYATIFRNGLALGVTNITFEYNTRFMNGARHGGAVYRGRVLYVNPQLCGWADNTPNYVTTGTGVTTGRWQHIVVNVRDGAPYPRSDLYVDGNAVFLDEPIEVTSFTTNTVGFLSPYTPGYVEWDNVRVADEQYGFTTQRVTGVYFATNNATPFYPFVPDYDPMMWEHDGSAMGAGYEWYAYLQGEGVHSAFGTKIYFAPRLRVEATNFPKVLGVGSNVVVPVEWENLPKAPAKLGIKLVDPYSGVTYIDKTNIVTTVSGSANYTVTIPAMPVGSNYLWSAYTCATNAANPWNERYGADDTFRFNRAGLPVEPETVIRSVPAVDTNLFKVYSDAGTPVGSSVFVWSLNNAAQFNGSYTGETPPEGLQSFQTIHTDYAGWGVFATTSVVDMRGYTNGFLKFSIKVNASRTMKVELQGPSGTARSVNIVPTANVWQEFSIPISSFGGINLQQVYGLFSITSPGALATTYLVDNVRWTH